MSHEIRQLSELDEQRLTGVLRTADIRLVRASWLLNQPPHKHLQRRQELEEEAFLSGEDAVALIRRATRAVGALTYGWLSPDDPDPTCSRLRILQEALNDKPYIEALFMDQLSLPQPPRSDAQEASFQRALMVMADLYASAVGTTVLQLKEIPARPVEFDGWLRLGCVNYGMTAEAVCAALSRCGNVGQCLELGPGSFRMRFECHQQAEAALATWQTLSSTLGTKSYCFIEYNGRPYDDRGWYMLHPPCDHILATTYTLFALLAARLPPI